MFKGNHRWNFDYVRLSLENGFSFEKPKSEDFDKSKICLVDIDRIISERDVGTVEKFIPSITKFSLDPDQSKLLDERFVKTFRMSQLAVEYLLFCKKYLDKTVVLLKQEKFKVEEENKELKLFVDDLKQHIDVLIQERTLMDTFKCDICNKIFSSQDFLNSHRKRRHSSHNNNETEAETDKLYSEIKELKGRLNSAEKLLQPDSPVKSDSKIIELQHKFEDLRAQVQSELKVLRTQQNFEEKYEKWVQQIAFSKFQDKEEVRDPLQRRESTTQTDSYNKIEVEGEKPDCHAQKIEELGVALETKVSTNLQKIEDNMQSFWLKLTDLESKQVTSPPPVKPRSKYTVKQPEADILIVQNDRSVCTEQKQMKSPSPRRISVVDRSTFVDTVDSSVQKTDKVSLSEISSECDVTSDCSYHEPVKVERVTEKQKMVPSPSTIVVEKQKVVSSVAVDNKIKVHHKPRQSVTKRVLDNDILTHFKKELEHIVLKRLQDLGISPDWTGLPTRTFQRALEIVSHQANMLTKSYPDFGVVSAQIESRVAKEINESQTNDSREIKTQSKRADVAPKIYSVRGKKASPPVEIKDRRLYDTDTDSDSEKAPQFRMSAVIEQLKSVTADKENLRKGEPKGVLRNFPSVGSLTKKRVLFNLENAKAEGDTTSVASSVLDGDGSLVTKHSNKKDVEDLSDLDFDF